jgi:acyl-CoA reductase-like NAD-dependent aldehyde dehydrogenase
VQSPQPLWATVPPAARARYLRRAAQATLDELDDLATALAVEAGVPRTEALLAEILPSVAGLGELADDGPRALRDRRLGRPAVLRAGRRQTMYSAPVGTVGIRGGVGSPWAELVLETAAALLAGNGVVLAPATPVIGARLLALMGRSGLPDRLLTVDDSLAGCDTTLEVGAPGAKGTMLVLEGAPLERTVSGALWAAFARAGHGPASVGRIVCVPAVTEGLLRSLEVGARRLKVGSPADPATEVGPLASAEDAARVEELVAEAESGGAVRLCGGPVGGHGPDQVFYAPVVLRNVAPDARILHESVPGPVLAVVEAASEDAALLLAAGAPALSVWTGERAQGERVVRTLGAELAWVNEHGAASPAAPVRIARHVQTRQLASRPVRLRSARWLPYDPSLVHASETAARLMYGRESERAAYARSGGPALVRVGARLVRQALGREW